MELQFCGRSCRFTGLSAVENAMDMASFFKQSVVLQAAQSAKFLRKSTKLLKEQ